MNRPVPWDPETKVCSRCQQEPASAGQRWGKNCWREYRRKARAIARRQQALPSVSGGFGVYIHNLAYSLRLVVYCTPIAELHGAVLVMAGDPADAKVLQGLTQSWPAWVTEARVSIVERGVKQEETLARGTGGLIP